MTLSRRLGARAQHVALLLLCACAGDTTDPPADVLSLALTSGTPAGFTSEPLPALRIAVRGSDGLAQPGPYTVTVTHASGPGDLEGRLQATATGGEARFDSLILTAAGDHQLRFSSPEAGELVVAASVTTPGPPQLVLNTQPPAASLTGERLVPILEVELRDHRGRRTSDTTRVTAVIVEGGGALSGRTTVAPVGGLARFDSLIISGAGRHRLEVRAAGFVSDTSNQVLVTTLPPHPTPLGLYAFTGVSVLPMDVDRVLSGHTVLIDSSRIVAIGPDGTVPLPPGTTVIDGAGRWLMPGLTDTHTHQRALPTWPADEGGNFLMMLANGVTSLWNMGDVTGALIPVRDEVRAGRLIGPAMYIGRFVRAPSEGGGPIVVVSTADQARALIADAVAKGYDFLKPYNQLTNEVFTTLLTEGRAAGLPVMGHWVFAYGLLNGMRDGQLMAVHASDVQGSLFGGAINDAQIASVTAQVAATGAWIGGTLAVFERIAQYGQDALAGLDPFIRMRAVPGREFMDDAALQQWEAMMQQRSDIRQPLNRFPALAFQQRFIKAFVDAGIPVLMGTDEIGIPGMVPGFAIHDEIRVLAGTGITPWQVLQTGTSNPGRLVREHMHPTDLHGTVEVGARADLLLLSEDPRANLQTLRTPVGVMAAGRYYPGDWLRAQLDTLRLTR